MGELNQYTLGSGHIHLEEFTDNTLPTNWDTFFFSTDNIIGRVKGGAAFEYTTDKYEDEDDLGYIVIEEITKEKVIMKSGIMTWNSETLTKLCSTARTTTLADGTVRVKIGGLGNQSNTRYVIGFEHKDKNLRVIIVGRNTEGFTFDFKQDSATVIDCQFRAEASDGEGTLIIIDDLRKRPILSGLSIGSLSLAPAYSAFNNTYTAATTNTKDAITATAKNSGDTVVIKNGSTTVTNGGDATWTTGENTVTVTVTDADGKAYTYTITVTKSGS